MYLIITSSPGDDNSTETEVDLARVQEEEYRNHNYYYFFVFPHSIKFTFFCKENNNNIIHYLTIKKTDSDGHETVNNLLRHVLTLPCVVSWVKEGPKVSILK